MTTSAISATLGQATNAAFQAWVTEVVTALFTTLGVTQTTDTGQINPATVAAPVAANASAGYVIGRFNDTLQATSPIFFKLEFGSGSAATDPQMYLTVGSASNGSGTITNGGGGAVTTRVAALSGGAPLSTVTNYTSRYVYLATSGIGYLGVVFKIGGIGSANTAFGAFSIKRTNDASGNATSNGVAVMTTGFSAANPGSVTTAGYLQCISFTSGSVIPTIPSNNWCACTASGILGLTTTIEGTTGFVTPTYTVDPVLRFSAYDGVALLGDFPINTTDAYAMVGSTSITFISCGFVFGGSSGFANMITNAPTFCMPWQ